DVMLALMTDSYFRDGKALGQVLEFCGEGLVALPLEERATLTNMAVEAGAMTGIMAADATTFEYLITQRGISRAVAAARALQADAGAAYAHHITLDLSAVAPMVATPGDPRNGVPLESLEEQ